MTNLDFSKAQLRVIWIAISITVLSFVCPPWKLQDEAIRSFGETAVVSTPPARPGRYQLIFLPPSDAVGIDMERVILQTAVIAILATGIVVTLGRRKTRP